MASILLFAMVNHISPASGKPYESRTEGVGITERIAGHGPNLHRPLALGNLE